MLGEKQILKMDIRCSFMYFYVFLCCLEICFNKKILLFVSFNTVLFCRSIHSTHVGSWACVYFCCCLLHLSNPRKLNKTTALQQLTVEWAQVQQTYLRLCRTEPDYTLICTIITVCRCFQNRGSRAISRLIAFYIMRKGLWLMSTYKKKLKYIII